MIGENTTTNITLNKIGKQLFKDRFLGVFMSNEIPSMKNKQMLITNTQSNKQGGEHWIGLYKYNDKTYFFDSFARDYKTLSKYWKNKNWVNVLENVNSHQIREQSYRSNACGAYSLNFLLNFDKYKLKLIKILNV
jgi:hypothetical protein